MRNLLILFFCSLYGPLAHTQDTKIKKLEYVIVDKNGIIKYISIGNSEGNVDKLAKEIKKLLSK